MSGIASIFRIPVAKVTEAEAVERIVAMAQVAYQPAECGCSDVIGQAIQRIGMQAHQSLLQTVSPLCHRARP